MSARAETSRFSKITFHVILRLRTIDMCILAGFARLDSQTSCLVRSCVVLDCVIFYCLIPYSTLLCCIALYCTVPQQAAHNVWEACVGKQAQTQATQMYVLFCFLCVFPLSIDGHIGVYVSPSTSA